MYTCCSKSVKLLVKASGRCGVIVTEIAKSNHFKGNFWSIFGSATETTFPVCFSRPGQVRSSSGVGSGSMLFATDKTKCLNRICLHKMTSKPALTMFSSLTLNYCWFAHDVTVAMLVVKNKSISVLWELNSTFI